MPRKRAYFIARVAARVDEVTPSGDNVGGLTAIEAPMESIDDELDFSALYVLRTGSLNVILPAVKGDLKHFHGDNVEDLDTRVIIDPGTKKITVVCPDDFARFVAMRMDKWSADLQVIMDPRSPTYRHQEYNKFTSGSTQKPKGYLVSFMEYVAEEKIKWVIDQTLSESEILSDLYNGQTPVSAGANVLATGDIVSLKSQEDFEEDGIYLINAAGVPTKLSTLTSNSGINCGQAIEVFRASSTTDTLTKFHYIPKLKAEEIPDELIDALVEHCAGRVFSQMGNIAARDASFKQADFLLGNLNSGLLGEK